MSNPSSQPPDEPQPERIGNGNRGNTPANMQGWVHAPTPVVEHSDTTNPITMAELTDEEAIIAVLRVVGPREPSTARAGGTILRHTIAAYVAVVLAPLVIDAIAVDIGPAHFGFDIGTGGDVRSAWVARRSMHATVPRSFHAHGRDAAAMLLPVATALRTTARIGDRGSDLAIIDRLNSAARQLERSPRCTAEAGWVEAFLEGTGIGNPGSIRTIAVPFDDGPPIDLPVARACCIGARRPSADLCPTCPVVGDDAQRRQRAGDWLNSLDDQNLWRLIGRQRSRPVQPRL